MKNNFRSDLLSLLRMSESDVFKNGRVKYNPRTGEIMEYVIASRPIFRANSAAERQKSKKKIAFEVKGESADGRERAAKRARKRLFELAACNDFSIFFTLTIDPKKLDRYDYKAVIKKVSQWLADRVRRTGFAYIAVPELHKDGAIHFHGLSNEKGLKLIDSGHKDKHGRPVYNVANWPYGMITTAVKLYGDYQNVCKYITKYITKGTKGTNVSTIGGRYFFHGGELLEPTYRYFEGDMNTIKEGSYTVTIEEAGGLKLCYANLKELPDEEPIHKKGGVHTHDPISEGGLQTAFTHQLGNGPANIGRVAPDIWAGSRVCDRHRGQNWKNVYGGPPSVPQGNYLQQTNCRWGHAPFDFSSVSLQREPG